MRGISKSLVERRNSAVLQAAIFYDLAQQREFYANINIRNKDYPEVIGVLKEAVSRIEAAKAEAKSATEDVAAQKIVERLRNTLAFFEASPTLQREGPNKLDAVRKSLVVAVATLCGETDRRKALAEFRIVPEHYEELLPALRKTAVRLTMDCVQGVKTRSKSESEEFLRAIDNIRATAEDFEKHVAPVPKSREWVVTWVWSGRDHKEDWGDALREYLHPGPTSWPTMEAARDAFFLFVNHMTTKGGKRDFGSVSCILGTKDGQDFFHANLPEEHIRKIQAKHSEPAHASEEEGPTP